MHLIFFQLKKAQKTCIYSFFKRRKAQKLWKYFSQAYKIFEIMEMIFASSQKTDLIFYMLEKAQKYGFGS